MNRDQILEHALKHELRGNGAATPGPDCVDAETLAAWQDGGLDAVRMSSVEAHVSSCARCQAMLGAFVRGGAVATEAEPARGFQLWKWWLAPIAAGAAAATLWMVVPDQQDIATRPAQPPPAADAFREQAVAPLAAPPAKPAEADAPKRDASAANRIDSDSRKLKAEVARERQQELKDSAATLKEQVLSQPAAAAPPPAAPAAAREERAAAPAIAGLQKNARLAFAPLEIPTPDPTRRWRVVDGRQIERTDDNGATWRLIAGVPDGTIVVGSAPSSSVAWFGANAGVVYLTTDGGATLQALNIGERLDIASISAIDARSATVTTAGGTFRTDDGGRTWRRIQA